jgi:hypothetical protein
MVIAACLLLAGETVLIAVKRPLWFDEIITVYMAHLSFHTALAALRSAADTNPPMLYPPVRLAQHFISQPALAVRLPSILFFSIFTYFLYRIARAYMPPVFAFLACLIPEVTFAANYSYEGRSYACILACATVALFSWREMCAGRRRIPYAVLLASSLALAISSHYSATLLFAVLASGEAVRILQKKSVDWLTLSALAVGVLPLLFMRPLLTALHVYLVAYWSKPTFPEVLKGWVGALMPGVHQRFKMAVLLPGGKLLPFLAVLAFFLPRLGIRGKVEPESIPLAEKVVWIVLLCAPIVGFIQGMITGGFTIRYALPMVIPYALLIALVLQALTRGSSAFALLSVALILFSVTQDALREVRESETAGKNMKAELNVLNHSSQLSSIVIGDPLLYSPLFFYAGPLVQPRLVYLSDPGLAAARLGFNSPDITLQNLAHFSPLQAVDYNGFLKAHGTFEVLLDQDPNEWAGKQFALEHVASTPQACYSFGCVYRVHP